MMLSPAQWGQSPLARGTRGRRAVRTHDHDQPPPAGLVDRAQPEQAIAEAAAACSNWGRWGEDDVRGTLNFLTDDKRVEGARLVRRGVSFSLAQPFDASGPQT